MGSNNHPQLSLGARKKEEHCSLNKQIRGQSMVSNETIRVAIFVAKEIVVYLPTQHLLLCC